MKLIISDIERVSAFTFFLKHRRIGGFAFLKVFKKLAPCLSQIIKRLGMCVPVDLVEPRIFPVLDCVKRFLE